MINDKVFYFGRAVVFTCSVICKRLYKHTRGFFGLKHCAKQNKSTTCTSGIIILLNELVGLGVLLVMVDGENEKKLERRIRLF